MVLVAQEEIYHCESEPSGGSAGTVRPTPSLDVDGEAAGSVRACARVVVLVGGRDFSETRTHHADCSCLEEPPSIVKRRNIMISRARVLVQVTLISAALAACGEGGASSSQAPDASATAELPIAEESGPLSLVGARAESDEVIAGTLEITGDCVTLNERGHARLTLAWPVDDVEWDDRDASITVTFANQRIELRDQDRITLTGERIDQAASFAWVAAPSADCGADGTWHVASVSESLTPTESSSSAGPIGGGIASGTGVTRDLECPIGVEEESTEWFGPATLTRHGAVEEAIGDLIVGWIGDPYELDSTDSWSSWGLSDDAGNLVAVVTVVADGGGWDPSHARFCVMPEPTPEPPSFTLYVSNQSFEDPTVEITVTIDGSVMVDRDFAVEGQHNWITFEPDVGPGVHTFHAISSTGAEFTTEFTLPADEARWAVLDYWFYPEEEPRRFTFDISDEPIGFG